MNSSSKLKALAALLSMPGLVSALAEVAQNPYPGQQARGIKSLPNEEITGLLTRKGAGLARAAELIGYPGPVHVLERAEPLKLDAAQLGATKQLMAGHKDRALRLGALTQCFHRKAALIHRSPPTNSPATAPRASRTEISNEPIQQTFHNWPVGRRRYRLRARQ